MEYVLAVVGAGRDWGAADVEAYLPVLAIVPTMIPAMADALEASAFAAALVLATPLVVTHAFGL